MKRHLDPNLIPVGLRLDRRDITRARRLAKKAGVPYQTWIRARIHEVVCRPQPLERRTVIR